MAGLPDSAYCIRTPTKWAQPGGGTGGGTIVPFTSLKVTCASPEK